MTTFLKEAHHYHYSVEIFTVSFIFVVETVYL